jgi:putative spermidine/putrescine transport system permease protein
MANTANAVDAANLAIPRRSIPVLDGIRRNWSSLVLSLPALVVILAMFVYPFIFGFDLSLRNKDNLAGAWTLDNYVRFFTDARQVATIWTTFQVSLPVTVLSVAISLPLAYLMRRGIRFERIITIILILPMTLGTVMVAQSMLSYFGPRGWFNLTLRSLGLISAPLRLTHNWIGLEIALFIQGFPFVFLMILGYMSGINPDLERASRMLGAKPWQTFWRVIFPLTLPGVAIAFCLNFVANFGVYPSAMLVGEPNAITRVLSIAAYQMAFEQYDQPMGTAIALVMGVIELSVVALVLWLRNRMARGATLGGGKGA